MHDMGRKLIAHALVELEAGSIEVASTYANLALACSTMSDDDMEAVEDMKVDMLANRGLRQYG